jgi:hypothetical protein
MLKTAKKSRLSRPHARIRMSFFFHDSLRFPGLPLIFLAPFLVVLFRTLVGGAMDTASIDGLNVHVAAGVQESLSAAIGL